MLKTHFLDRLDADTKVLYDYSLVPEKFSKDDKITLICKKCGKSFLRIVSSQLRGATCPYCGLRKRYTTESFIAYAIKLYGTKYRYDKVIYKRCSEKVTIICNECNKEFSVTVNNFLQGRGCPHCKNKHLSECFRKSKEEFIKNAKKIHGNNYDYSKVIYKNSQTHVIIICNTCGHECSITPSNHLKGKGCKKCGHIKQSLTVRNRQKKLFLAKAKKLYNDRYDYSYDEYEYAEEKIKILCKKHHIFFEQTPVGHLHGTGCPLCSPISKGELEIFNILNDMKIDFVQQKRFSTCKYIYPLPFDFYLPKYNTCIEFQGQQHYESNDFFGGKVAFELRKKRDKIKKDFCKMNNIVLLEIRYDDNIKEKLNEFLLITKTKELK